MQNIKQILTRLIETLYRSRKVLLALSCLVVFIVTYVLILPAFTLEKDEAAELGGIDVPAAEMEAESEDLNDSASEQADNNNTEKAESAKTQKKIQKAEAAGNLTFEGKGFTVAVDDKKSVLPNNTEVVASELLEKPAEGTKAERRAAEKAYKKYYDLALEAVKDDAKGGDIRTISFVKFYDIALQSSGEEVQPNKPVNVTISYDKAQQKELKVDEKKNVRIIHFSEDQATGEITAELLKDDAVDVSLEQKKMTETTFEAEGFSVYGVVYTVDFSYEVDGKTYEYSIGGGEGIGLSELLPVLGVIKDDKDTEGDEVSEFISQIEDVKFSDSSLVSVSKEDNDWILMSLKAFDTEENLTVIMKNGDQFEIKVTDAQLQKYVISDSGDTYEVTVTYDDSAEIPEDAELKVREIQNTEKKYDENLKATNKQLKAMDKAEVDNPVQFDISIVSDGKEIEPKEGSTVSVEIRLAPEAFMAEESKEDPNPKSKSGKEADKKSDAGEIWFNGELIESGEGNTNYMVSHITGDGDAEIIEEVSSSIAEDDNIVLEFETESFSDYLMGNPDGLGVLPSTICVGDEIYMWQRANYWVSNIGSVVTETKHPNGQGGNDGSDWKTVTAINTGTFRIYDRYNQNNYKEIRVLPARTGTKPPSTIETVDNTTIGLTLNLFDYDLDNYLDDYFNNFNHGDNPVSNNFQNHGINNGHALKFWGSGIGNNYGSANQYQQHGVTSIVQRDLAGGVGGYPQLTSNSNPNGSTESLQYLFAPSDGTDKKAYTNVNGLFKKEGDYYIYDSNTNYAYYDTSQGNGGRFAVYNSTYKQKSGGESGSLQDKAIGFFPFHKWDDQYDLYVNWNKTLNHHFGMSMSVPFSLPKDPKAVVDTEGNPIVFEFSGDDDMWVFIDGKLAMDIGGIHQPTSGTINFKDQTVTVNGNSQSFNFSNLYDGNKHTLQVFYIERGGCDSNCMIKFNLTQYGDVHFDKVDKDNRSEKLAGAVFGIYKDQACTEPLLEQLKNGTSRAYVAESNAQGRVQFSDIPLGTYYLKELHAPEGYPVDNTIHTVNVILNQQTQEVKVTIDGTDVGTGVNILNGKPAPIDLGLKKEWQDADGEAITAPAGTSATFEIKRIRSYEKYTEQTIEEGREVSHLTVGWIHNGQTHIYKEFDLIANSQATVSWGYISGYNGSKDCILNGEQIDKDYVSGNVVSHAFTMPAANGSATIFIVDESENGEAINSINVAGLQFYGNSGGGVIHTFETITEPDTTFNYTGDHVTNNQVTLPIGENTWQYLFENLPTFGRGLVDGVDHDVSFNYSYYLEEVSNTCPEGTTTIYKDLSGNVVSSPTDVETHTSGTETIINKVPVGYLRIDKSVTYNGVAPSTAEQKSDLAGTYTFKVYTDENCSKPYKVIQGTGDQQQETDLTLTVTIGNDGAAKSSDVVKLPVGNYWIEEVTPDRPGVTPEANRLAVTVSNGNTSSEPGVVSFVNNREASNDPDEMAIELEKTFNGLPDASKIPGDFKVLLTYRVPGSTEPETVELTGTTAGHVTCTKSEDGMTWHWHVTHIPAGATGFSIYEDGYDIPGYTRITNINGQPVEDPGSPQSVTILPSTISMTNMSREYYVTADNDKAFTVEDNQILLVRMTNHATVVVSQKSLGISERNAIEKMIHENGGKIPGDKGAHAQWVENFVYFSHEIQGDSFSYGGRTIYFEGKTVIVPHKSSSHEVRVDIGFTSENADNSFTLSNSYSEVPINVDVLKVEKGRETDTHLPGAGFALRTLEDVAPSNPGGTLTYKKGSDNKEIVVSKETGDDGRLTFDSLTSGYYEIRETKSPAGYVLSEDVIFYFKVDAGVVTYIEKGSGKPSTWTGVARNETIHFTPVQTGETGNSTFRVGNEPGAELPHTGGIGTTIFYILGSLLVVGSAVVLISRRRIRK